MFSLGASTDYQHSPEEESASSSTHTGQSLKSHTDSFTSIHALVESDDRSDLPNNGILAFFNPDSMDHNISLRNQVETIDFAQDLNLDMLDGSDLFLNQGLMDVTPIDYSSTPTSTSSSPPARPNNRASPTGSQRSSFSLSKNPSSTSIANQAHQATEKKPSEALANYQFGRELATSDAVLPDQPSTSVQSDSSQPPSYMPDFNPDDWNNTSNLKFKLQIQDIPAKSRVETQIKVVMNFYPPPSETIVHLPADTISKPKLQLRTPFTPIPSALSIDTIVVCESDPSRHINICQGCLKRERKRAFRKKVRLPIEEAHWREDKEKRAIVFNCREVMDFGPLATIEVDGKTVQSRQIELPMRMACYCRHHNEKAGFRALFVVRDYQGKVVARGSTSSIVITDDHKATSQKASIGMKRPSEGVDEDPSPSPEVDPPRKRKQASRAPSFVSHTRPAYKSATTTANPSPRFSPVATPSFMQSPLSPQPNGYKRTSSLDNLSLLMSRPVSAALSPRDSPSHVLSPPTQSVDERLYQENIPAIQRIIPGSGSIRGGIEVTLLGSGFTGTLVPKFGENKSSTNHCWNSTTIVTLLPPSRIEGPVVVTFDGFTMPVPQVFTYFDDTDHQLIELALQVVGLKMNGRLEDARDIARRIVKSTTAFDDASVQQLQNSAASSRRATNLSLDHLENLLLKCLDLIDSFASNYTPNWQHPTSEGQTMLHLAACLGLNRFAAALLERGSRLDVQDKSGYTPLHFAGLHQNETLIALFLYHGANPQQHTYTGETYLQLKDKCSSVPISQASYIFNESLDSESESDGEEEAAHPDDVRITKSHRLMAYLESWRDVAGFRKSALPPIHEGDASPTQSKNLWDLMYPNTGNLLYDVDDDACTVTSISTVQAPPRYEEIFPAGSSSTADFSGAALDDEKPEVVVAETERVVQPVVVPSEEEVLEAWKNKRKKIQNDRMFLYFWLPVFIFILVWVSMKAVVMFDTMDATGALREKVNGLFKGLARSTTKKLAEPGLNNAPSTTAPRIVEVGDEF